MKVIGVIPARYMSSRFPGKPLVDICGKPMIWWVYQQAKKVPELDDVIVATDSEAISAVCKELELNVRLTSDQHRTGADRVAEIAENTDGDIYLNIQGDEPLIEPKAIRQIITEMIKCPEEEYIGLRSTLQNEQELLNPNVVKAITDLSGYAMYFSRVPIPYNHDIKNVYRVMGLYGYKRDFLIRFGQLGQSALELCENGVEMLRAMEHGHKIKLIDTDYVSIAVDLPSDVDKVVDYMNGMRNDE